MDDTANGNGGTISNNIVGSSKGGAVVGKDIEGFAMIEDTDYTKKIDKTFDSIDKKLDKIKVDLTAIIAMLKDEDKKNER